MAETAGRTEVRLSLTDVSDRVAALHARDLTEARFRSLFASSPNAVLVVDGEGRIVDASDRAVEIFGHSADTLRHLGIEDLVPPLERDRHASLRHQLQDVRPDHHPVSPREVSGLRADGSLIPVEVGLSWFETAEGWFATAIVVDVSARRSLEAQVDRKARLEAIGQLAGGSAHDSNTVLTAIGGVASLSLDHLDAGPPVDREAIATIAAGAARTSALTRQLLAF